MPKTARRHVNRNPHTALAISQGALWTLFAIISLVSLAALALALHNIIVGEQRHNDRNKHVKSVGVSAFKNTTQDTVDGMAVDVIGWQVGGGYPSYDNSKGGYNATAGEFTVRKEAIYNAVATVCFNATNTTGVREVHLVTSGAEELVVVGRINADASSTGEDCVTVSQNQWLVEDAVVSVMAYTDSGFPETIVEGTLFSIERIAKYSD